ncbi:MAG: repeat-containing protein, partial [Deltaproteobacteria bacterium]|nr:repeat-containing protein [Deltaproteobacteria bacterium]
MAGAKGGKEKQQIEAKIADDERFFQANEMFERGSTYAEKGQFDKAIEDYNKAIDLYPDNVLAYYYRGMAYYKKNQYSKAFEDYRKAININQNAYDNYYGLVYYNSGVTHIKEGYSGGFIYDIGDAVFDPPVSDDDYFDHPFLDEELKILTTKISIDTNNAVAFYKRGNVYLNKGLFDKSIKDYDRAITINPDYSL